MHAQDIDPMVKLDDVGLQHPHVAFELIGVAAIGLAGIVVEGEIHVEFMRGVADLRSHHVGGLDFAGQPQIRLHQRGKPEHQ